MILRMVITTTVSNNYTKDRVCLTE